MLKIIGTNMNNEVEDEKVLLDEEGKLTQEGVCAIVLVAFALIGAICVLKKVCKFLFGSKKDCCKSCCEE